MKSDSRRCPLRCGSAAARGQSSVEYAVVCAALALALGVGMAGDDSVLKQLLDAFGVWYQRTSFALSVPL